MGVTGGFALVLATRTSQSETILHKRATCALQKDGSRNGSRLLQSTCMTQIKARTPRHAAIVPEVMHPCMQSL